MSRETYRVAIVVMCEAEGVDERDAGAGAEIALRHIIRNAGKPDLTREKVGLAGPERCAHCGAVARLTKRGKVWAHVLCETWPPRAGQQRCEGSGKSPRESDEMVVGFMRGDRLPIYARVHQVMDAGMAAGNGYLWLRPTAKAFR